MLCCISNKTIEGICIIKFFEQHDLSCVMCGLVKLFPGCFQISQTIAVSGSEFPSYLRNRCWLLWCYIFIVLRICQDFMLFTLCFQFHDIVLFSVIKLDSEPIDDPEIHGFGCKDIRNAILISANADITVRTDDPAFQFLQSITTV